MLKWSFRLLVTKKSLEAFSKYGWCFVSVLLVVLGFFLVKILPICLCIRYHFKRNQIHGQYC